MPTNALTPNNLTAAPAFLTVPSFNPPVIISDYALDNGMTTFPTLCDRIYVCTGPITDFASVISTALGYKNFGAGNAFGGINTGSPSGRTVTSIAFTNGNISVSGMAICWAAVDFADSHLLAWGVLSGDVQVTGGQLFGLPSFTIHESAYFSGVNILIACQPAISLATQAAGFDRPIVYAPNLNPVSLAVQLVSFVSPSMTVNNTLMAFSFQPNHANAFGTPVLVVSGQSFTAVPRNVFQQPFGINSVWNTPIGIGTGGLVSSGTGSHGGAQFSYTNNNGAIYEFANLNVTLGINNDESPIVFGPASPLKTVFTNTAGWSGSDRCSAVQTAIGTQVPIPPTAYYPSSASTNYCTDAGTLGTTVNNSGVILLADRHSLYQTQPMHICTIGGPPTTEYFFSAGGNVSIFADETSTPPSAYGAHGGSNLSSFGGVVRYNEIIPGNCPILPGVADVMRHALSMSFYSGALNAFTGAGGHVWPATNGDTGNEGLLLALLPTFNLSSLSSLPGKSVAWTLMNYGAYVVDTNGSALMDICGEFSYSDSSVNVPTGRTACQFETVWGYSMINFSTLTTAWPADMELIAKNLYVVTNNSPTSIGGLSAGGRMMPLAATPVDPGVVTSIPVVNNTNWSSIGLASGQLIAQSTASNSPYWWALSGTGSTNFWIQPTTGLIYTAVSAIPIGTYNLTVTATNVAGNGTGTISISVTSVISSAPVVTGVTDPIQLPVTVGENVGSPISATNNPTSWAITAGNTSGFFAISNGGQITIANTSIPVANYSLTVQATNSIGSGTGTVTINVSAAAGAAPVVTNTSANLTLPVTQNQNLVVVSATNGPTSWAITAGDTWGNFGISSSGQLFVNYVDIPPATYTLTVKATNSSGFGNGTITVTAGVHGTVYHITKTGNDGAAGSAAAPWASFAHAAGVVSPGDAVLVHAGAYTQAALTMSRGGSSTFPVIWAPFGTDSVTITSSSTSGFFFELNSINYVIFMGFTINGNSSTTAVASGNLTGVGILGSSFIYTSHLTVTQFSGGGIDAQSGGTNNSIMFCTSFQNCMNDYNNAFGNAGGWAQGIASYTANSLVYGCTVYHNWGEGIDLINNNGTTVANCTVYDNMGPGIYCTQSENCSIYNNLVYYTGSTTWVRSGGSQANGLQTNNENALGSGSGPDNIVLPLSNNKFYNNVVVGTATNFIYSQFQPVGIQNCLISNNTFVNSLYQNLIITANASTTGNIFENNIFYGGGQAPSGSAGGCTFRNNCWFGQGGGVFAGSGDITSNPQFTGTIGSFTTTAYQLASGSPCKNSGQNVSGTFTFDIAGNARPGSGNWTIGAWQ
jgi:parallel beta-helix repeat protein